MILRANIPLPRFAPGLPALGFIPIAGTIIFAADYELEAIFFGVVASKEHADHIGRMRWVD